MSAGTALLRANEEMRQTRAKVAAQEAGNMRRAVSDVMDGTSSLDAAHKAWRVNYDVLRKELKARGWVPPLKRKGDGKKRHTFGSGKRHGT